MHDHDETYVAPHVDARSAKRDRAYLIVLSGSNLGEMFKVATSRVVIGRSKQSDVVLPDVGVSRAHAEISSRGDEIVIRDLDSRNGTYCNGVRVDEHPLRDGDKIQLGQTTILKFTFSDDLDESFQRRMYDSALRDSLTSAFNKRYFGSQLETEFGFARRHGSPLSLILLDLDDLKTINDRHGHLAGDQVLARVAQIVAGVIRSEDLFARFGGDEFAILCRAISLVNAARLAERVRAEIEAHPVEHEGAQIRATISAGAAALPDSAAETAEQLLAAADRALYRAKNSGRNRVEIDRGES